MTRARFVLALCAAVFFAAQVVAFANPFLVCDPQKGVTHYRIYGLPGANETTGFIEVEAVMDDNETGHLHYDLAGLPNGDYSVNVTAYNNLWGLESPPTPFDISKTPLASPSALRVVAK